MREKTFPVFTFYYALYWYIYKLKETKIAFEKMKLKYHHQVNRLRIR